MAIAPVGLLATASHSGLTTPTLTLTTAVYKVKAFAGAPKLSIRGRWSTVIDIQAATDPKFFA